MEIRETKAGDASLVPDSAISPDSLNPDELRLAFRHHAAGVALITADPGDGPVAMTATSVFSVSATPPLLVFSASSLSSATASIVRATSVVVHLLGADQLHLAKLGATPGVDRFADLSTWRRLPTGEPYFPEAPSWIRGTIVSLFEAGGSTLIVVNATAAHHPPVDGPGSESESVRPLVYHNRTWHHLGDHSVIP